MRDESKPIRLCQPVFDDADRARIDDVLRTGMLVQGRYVAEVEAALSDLLGVAVVACNSGTAALHLSLLARGIGPGDEVIVPGFTWPSTAHVIVQVGATPIFVDVEPERCALTYDAVERAFTPATRAVIPVHLFGIPAPIEPLVAWAHERGVDVIEDAACALGTRLDDGTLAGTVGTLGCFSLHPRKSVTTGEGGFIAVRDVSLERSLRAWRNHGQVVGDDGVRFAYPGLNYRLPELSAAIGVGQISRFPELLAARRTLATRYLASLSTIEGVRIPDGVAHPGNSLQSFVIDVGARRDAVLRGLRARGIECTIGTYAVVSQPFYMRTLRLPAERYPCAMALMDHLLTLPLHPSMSASDVDRVCAGVRDALLS